MNVASTSLKHFTLSEVTAYLEKMHKGGFFGTIQLGFQAGKITTLQEQQILRPGDSLDLT